LIDMGFAIRIVGIEKQRLAAPHGVANFAQRFLRRRGRIGVAGGRIGVLLGIDLGETAHEEFVGAAGRRDLFAWRWAWSPIRSQPWRDGHRPHGCRMPTEGLAPVSWRSGRTRPATARTLRGAARQSASTDKAINPTQIQNADA